MTNYHFGPPNFTHTWAHSYAPLVGETQRTSGTFYNAHTLSDVNSLKNLG